MSSYSILQSLDTKQINTNTRAVAEVAEVAAQAHLVIRVNNRTSGAAVTTLLLFLFFAAGLELLADLLLLLLALAAIRIQKPCPATLQHLR